MSTVFKDIYDNIKKHYITVKDLEMLLYTNSITRVINTLAYQTPFIHIYSISLTTQTGTPNNFINVLYNNYIEINNAILSANVNNVFDVSILHVDDDNIEVSLENEYKNINYGYVSDDAINVGNLSSLFYFNMLGNTMYDFEDMTEIGNPLWAFRYIQLNDYTSSFIKLPVIFMNSKNSTIKNILAILQNIAQTIKNQNTTPTSAQNIRTRIREELRRVIFRDYIQDFINSNISSLYRGVAAASNITEESTRILHLYSDGFILEYSYSPVHEFNTYFSNNLEKYEFMFVDIIGILEEYIMNVINNKIDKSIEISNRNIDGMYEVLFDIILEEERLDPINTNQINNYITTYGNYFFYNFKYYEEISNYSAKNVSFDAIFTQNYNYINGIAGRYYSTVAYYDIADKTIKNGSESATFNIFEVFNRFVIVNKRSVGSTLLLEPIYYYSLLFERYHSDIRSLRSMSHLELITTSSSNTHVVLPNLIKNKMEITNILYFVINPVIMICYGKDITEKIEGYIKYNKVRYCSYNKDYRSPSNIPYFYQEFIQPATGNTQIGGPSLNDPLLDEPFIGNPSSGLQNQNSSTFDSFWSDI